jgi:hypothetical protein
MIITRNARQVQHHDNAPVDSPVNIAVRRSGDLYIPHCVLCGREHWHGNADGLLVAHCRGGAGATYRVVVEAE